MLAPYFNSICTTHAKTKKRVKIEIQGREGVTERERQKARRRRERERKRERPLKIKSFLSVSSARNMGDGMRVLISSAVCASGRERREEDKSHS
jgi:hypothetical protein